MPDRAERYGALAPPPVAFQQLYSDPVYSAGLKLAIERGWLVLHESGTYVKFTQSGADLFVDLLQAPDYLAIKSLTRTARDANAERIQTMNQAATKRLQTPQRAILSLMAAQITRPHSRSPLWKTLRTTSGPSQRAKPSTLYAKQVLDASQPGWSDGSSPSME